jgi:peptide deformylase
MAHDFTGKGRGLAAPQIGLDAAAAVVYSPGAAEPIVLLNPAIVESSAETDLQYEGCLSFFDTRSRIPRSLRIHVEHTDLEGHQRITVFEQGLARLVAHEVDHLHGVLCSDHLPEGDRPIPVEEYRGTGAAWQYRDLVLLRHPAALVASLPANTVTNRCCGPPVHCLRVATRSEFDLRARDRRLQPSSRLVQPKPRSVFLVPRVRRPEKS